MQKSPRWLPIALANSVKPPFFCWRKFPSCLLWPQSNHPILRQPAVIWFSFHMYILTIITEHQYPSFSEISAYIRISLRYSKSTDRCFVVISWKDLQLCLVHCTNLKLTLKLPHKLKQFSSTYLGTYFHLPHSHWFWHGKPDWCCCSI